MPSLKRRRPFTDGGVPALGTSLRNGNHLEVPEKRAECRRVGVLRLERGSVTESQVLTKSSEARHWQFVSRG